MVGFSPIVANKQHPAPAHVLINKGSNRGEDLLRPNGTLLCVVKGWRERLKLAEELSGDIALQASLDVADGLALGEATLK
jgi:hypothetical protein